VGGTKADDATDRISPHGYSVTDDEKVYLRRLCDGPADAHEFVDALAADPSVSRRQGGPTGRAGGP